MSTDEPFHNPLSRKRPLGGPTGVAIASIVPLVALALFLIFGFMRDWAWSWVFFLLIPIVAIAVYGLGGRNGSQT